MQSIQKSIKDKNDCRNEYKTECESECKSECKIKECDDKCQKYIKMYENDDVYKIKNLTSKAILYVIAVVSNPARFETRYRLFNEFCKRMKHEKNVVLVTVELQQRARPFITDSIIKLKTDDEIWYKENLINIGVQHLPDDWEYMAWIDADVEFQNKNWVSETIEQLQTYKILQLFSHAIDLGVKKETLQVHLGFAYQYVNGEKWLGPKYSSWHPGYAWACRRSAYDEIGGLMEFPILGSADHHMSLAFIGLVEKYLNSALHPNYKLLCKIFQDRCERHIKRNIGFVHGTILHYFHGNKQDRRYQDRWKILINNNFDPLVDIKKDSRNLWQLEDNKPQLRDEIMMYFRQRNEDSVDMPCDYKYVKGKFI
jgi:hypothetical protein